jgi:hypothetical protein
VPVGRIVQVGPFLVDHLTSPSRSEEAMVQEEVRCTMGSAERRPISSRLPELAQTPHGTEGFVERGTAPGGADVTVPPSVRPLPPDQRARQELDAVILVQPESAAEGECVSLLRRAPSGQAIDDLDAGSVILASKPLQDRLGRGDSGVVPGRDLQLDQRYESPVRTVPFR